VWVWAGGSLVLLWIVAKWRDMKKAAQTAAEEQPDAAAAAGGEYASEGQAVAPQFIIENNMPQSYVPVPTPGPAPPASAPVSTLPAPVTTPVVTPPGHTAKPPVAAKPAAPAKSSKVSKPPLKYKVQSGDTLSEIAAKHTNPTTGKRFTAGQLFEYNTTPGVRPASTITTLKRRGPNKIYPGETIIIPQ
jgi:nucleoid-associated protein YgaU